MNDGRWFDDRTGVLALDELVVRSPGFVNAVADGRVTAEELDAQSARVVEALRRLEGLLDEAQHAAATAALCELAVLHALRCLHEPRN